MDRGAEGGGGRGMMSVMRKEAKSDREKRAVKLTRPHQRTAMLEPSWKNVKNITNTL